MHALAAYLNTSTEHIERGMSAREFNGWCAWMDSEQVGPAWDRVRHAELLAAIYNGACEREGGGRFSALDFMPKPEQSEQEKAAEQIAAEMRAAFGAMNWAGTKGVH